MPNPDLNADFESVFNAYVDVDISEAQEPTDPITFITSSWGLGRTLLPVQTFVLKLLYGIELDDSKKTVEFIDYETSKKRKFTEAGYLDYLNNTPLDGRPRCNVSIDSDLDNFLPQELFLACGRRGGKTHLIGDICLYEAYKVLMKHNPQNYYDLPEGFELGMQLVASSADQAGKVYKEIRSGLKSSQFFAPYIVSISMERTVLRSPNDLAVIRDHPGRNLNSLEIIVSPCDADSVRGSGNILVVMDELCHYKDNTRAKSSKKVYESLTPSIATFGNDGKILTLSSPKDKSKRNKGYVTYTNSFNNPDILMVQAPTWEMNPTVKQEFLKKRHVDDGFWTEYGARFAESSSDFLSKEDRDSFFGCFRRHSNGDYVKEEMSRRIPHANYYATFDPSNRRHGYAGAVGHAEGGTVVVDIIKCWYPDDFEEDEDMGCHEIDVEVIEEWVAEKNRYYRFKEVSFDQFDSTYVRQRLKKHRGIRRAVSNTFTEKYNSLIYKTFLTQMRLGKISLYYHEELVDQFLDLEKSLRPHNQIAVKAKGGEDSPGDDIVDAVVHLVYRVYTGEIAGKGSQKPQAGTRASQNEKALAKSKRAGVVPKHRQKNKNTAVREAVSKGGRWGRGRKGVL